MSLTQEQFYNYLDRIHYTGERDNIKPTLETLCALQEAHVNNVPFENLDISLGKEIDLSEQSLYQKIVVNKRGGYCYENNELFALVLEHIGFTVHRSVSRVVFPESRARGHKILFVEMKGHDTETADLYLVDTGFSGNTLRKPLRLPPPNTAYQEKHAFEEYQLIAEQDKFKNNSYRLQVKIKETWVDMYTFHLLEMLPIDYYGLNYTLSHDPLSPFVNHVICAKTSHESRVMLIDSKLKIRTSEGTQEVILVRQEYFSVLEKEFGIIIPEMEKGKVLSKVFESLANKPISFAPENVGRSVIFPNEKFISSASSEKVSILSSEVRVK